MKNFRMPRPYHVYCDTGETWQGKPHITRLGAAKDLQGIRDLIEEDKRAMRQTFGGLIAPVNTKGRSYGAFMAEWTEVDLSTL